MEMLFVYLMGLISGAVGMLTLTFFIGKRAISRTAELSDTKSETSMNSRMKRVKDINDAQIDLLSRTDGPQKNSLDGKYKNSVNATVKQLEEEKIEILKSIIRDGHDPEITTLDPAGTVTRMKLSRFMADSGMLVEPATAKEPPKPSQIGKFTVYRGGKDDKSN